MRATLILVLCAAGCGGRPVPSPTPPPPPPPVVVPDPPAATTPPPRRSLPECPVPRGGIDPPSDSACCVVRKDRSLRELEDGERIPQCYSAMNVFDVCLECSRSPLRLPEDADLVPGDDAR